MRETVADPVRERRKGRRCGVQERSAKRTFRRQRYLRQCFARVAERVGLQRPVARARALREASEGTGEGAGAMSETRFSSREIDEQLAFSSADA